MPQPPPMFSPHSKAAYVPPAPHGEFAFMHKVKCDRMAFSESNSVYLSPPPPPPRPPPTHFRSYTHSNMQYILPVPHEI